MSRINRWVGVGVAVYVLTGLSSAGAQDVTVAHQHEAGHEHGATGPVAVDEVSGTAWLPTGLPMFAWHQQAGGWMVMTHGNAFVQYVRDAGPRGHEQFGSTNWVMLMAQRPVRSGQLTLKGMVSVEPWTIGGCGYPDLLASGERCQGRAIHDQQHPHDALMELAASYSRPIRGQLSWQVYGGIAGEPALGPVAFPHRPSSTGNPLAPISHHWLDATHVTFGVVTAAVSGPRWKAESSVFNGREPDEDRTDVDYGRLDSFSGRLSLLARPGLVLQVSGGHLKDVEPAHDGGGAATDLTRVTASAVWHRARANGGWLASTVAWGMNRSDGVATHAVLAETHLALRAQDAIFGRVEVVGKDGHDLAVEPEGAIQTLAKLQAGYTRYLPVVSGLQTGLGIEGSAGVVPATLRAVYGSRLNGGLAVFLSLRPRPH